MLVAYVRGKLGSGFSEESKRREDRGGSVILWCVFQLLELPNLNGSM